MNIQEARKALMDQWFAPLIEHDGNKFAAAADAYALQAHCDACNERLPFNSLKLGSTCGDGWWCDRAREIQEL